MKKMLSLVLALVMTLSLVACGDQGAQNDDPANDGEVTSINATIVGGSIGGAWAAIGEGVAEVVRRDLPGSVVSYEVGSEAANIALVSTGDVDMGIAHTSLLKLAADGSAPFKSQLGNLRALCVLYGEACEQFFIKNSTGITSFEDLVAQKYPLKVNFNTKDSFMELLGSSVVDFYGASAETIQSWGGNVDYMSMGNSIDLMRDGKLDAYSNVIQVPASNVVDAATSMELTMLSLSDECCDYLNDLYGTYTTVIPAGSYTFVNEDVQTVAASVVLYASADMSDSEAYAIVQAIYNNFDYFKSIHSSLANITVEDLEATDPIPMHPGAQQFFDTLA